MSKKKDITKVYIEGGFITIEPLEKYVSYKATQYIGNLKLTKRIYPHTPMEAILPKKPSND